MCFFISKNQLSDENKTAGQSLFASPLCNQCRPVCVVTSAPQFLCCYISSAVIRRYRFSLQRLPSSCGYPLVWR